MAEKKVTITSSTGVHARPAGLFAQAAKAAGVPITLRKTDGPEIDGTSILSVMSLAAAQGDDVVITVADTDGVDAEALVEQLAEILLG